MCQVLSRAWYMAYQPSKRSSSTRASTTTAGSAARRGYPWAPPTSVAARASRCRARPLLRCLGWALRVGW